MKLSAWLPPASKSTPQLPKDQRQQLGGCLFLLSLLIFFISSILLYAIYAYSRRGDLESTVPLPGTFLLSTVCLLLISLLVHAATRLIRREKRKWTSLMLGLSAAAALLFMYAQFEALTDFVSGDAMSGGTARGVAAMVAVLAILHALHVAGGVIALGIVSVGSLCGRYDHESHWPVDFAAQYWHFLDVVWLLMLLAFWLTTGGFAEAS